MGNMLPSQVLDSIRPLGGAQGSRHDNNFQLIKILAATTVLLCHSIPVAWGPNSFPSFISALGVPIYDMAVDVFFVVSGYLVVGSLVRRGNIVEFAVARLRRLLPALALSVWGSLFLVAIFFTRLSWWEFWSRPQTWKFAIYDAFPLIVSPEQVLPGAFWRNPLPGLVNPSLWTLPWEVRMYICLAILFAIASRVGKWPVGWWILGVYLVSCILGWWLHVSHAALHPLVLLLFRFLPPFFGGAAMWTWRERILLDVRIAGGLFAILFVAIWSLDAFFAAYQIALPYLVVFLGVVPDGGIRGFNRLGDYSYGIYIYGFPFQQMLTWWMGPLTLPVTMGLSFAGALALAVPSWHFLEKPMLRQGMKRNWTGS